MASGYKIVWSIHALNELEETFKYLEENFTKRELRRLSSSLDKTLKLISKSPTLFPFSNTKNIRRVVVFKYNTLYYQKTDDTIEIISFFSNRKNPI